MLKVRVYGEEVTVCCPDCGQNFRLDRKSSIIYPPVLCADGKIRSWSEASKREGFCAYCKTRGEIKNMKLLGMGHRQTRMLRFLQNYIGWQTMENDANTQRIAHSLVKRGLVEKNEFGQFRLSKTIAYGE
jgi:hypothetical protein